MDITEKPPSSWDTLVTEPCQTLGFARAMQTLGYRPFYLYESNHGMLALVRGLYFGVGKLTSRANLFATGSSQSFVMDAIRALAKLGIAHVKVGDTMWGLDPTTVDAAWSLPRTQVVERNTFVLDLNQSEEILLKLQESSVRSSLRKTAREGVTIRELESEKEIEAYIDLAVTTSVRVRQVTAYTNFPAVFFRELFRELSTRGIARFYMAFINEIPLAGGVFLCSKDRMLYFAGASSRDRKWTSLQSPTSVIWHAIRNAKRLGLSAFDFGGCTLTEDKNDPRYRVYVFKKRWGGDVQRFLNLFVAVSPTAHYLQERIMSPVWDRVHPYYFRLLELRNKLSASSIEGH